MKKTTVFWVIFLCAIIILAISIIISNRLPATISRNMCEGVITWNVDYTNDSTVHESLIKWVEENESEGKILNSDYDTIWSNTKASMHRVSSKEYKFLYVVYYNEPEMDFEQGIFSVDRECWID
jgi:hypothetical protein